MVTVFSTVLLFVLGAGLWTAATRHYQANLVAAASIEGKVIPQREYQRELEFQLIPFYVRSGVPPGFEDDERLARERAQYEEIALDVLVEKAVLDRAARENGITADPAAVESRYQTAFSAVRARHVLIGIEENAEDPELAEAVALAKARYAMNELRSAPMDDRQWERIAERLSEDPGSRFSGGELGFASKGTYVPEFEAALESLGVGEISEPVKTQFGFHVIQLVETRGPRDNEIVLRYLASGFSEADLREAARYQVLRDELDRRARESVPSGPVEQVRLAQIVVAIPALTATNFEDFSAALEKINTVRTALDEGQDFAAVAAEHSDDLATAEEGGEVGWIARGMTVELDAEDAIFAAEEGGRTEVSRSDQTIFYKVLERDGARELTEEQRETLTNGAYRYWLERQKRAYDVRELVPGLALD